MISIQRLGYHNDDPYDWEILNEQNQLNPSMKTEPQKQTSEKISHLKQNQSQSLKPTINEQSTKFFYVSISFCTLIRLVTA